MDKGQARQGLNRQPDSFLEEQAVYAYWFHGNHFAGNRKMWEISEKIGTPKQIYECGIEELKVFLTEKQAGRLERSKHTWDLYKKWEELIEEDIRFLPFFHKEYPAYLNNIPDPPWGIYVKGKLPSSRTLSAAVIGARQCSEYGRHCAKKIGELLGENGIPVISGMARGIDGIGQRAALEAGGESFAVLGCGVDVCYPKENRGLYHMLEKQGGILSEYPPKTQPAAVNFPPRNRIISGLSDLLIVVEAKEKSGTLITVDMALEQGKEVFALPGRVTDALSAGCNHLIRQGAGILTSPEDILPVLGIEKRRSDLRKLWERSEEGTLINDPEERRVYRALDSAPKNIEQIWLECGTGQIDMRRLMEILLEFCVTGIAVQEGGCYYRL